MPHTHDTPLQVFTGLPDGFGTLRMETGTIKVQCRRKPYHTDRPPQAGDQLCRLLARAPASYRRATDHTAAHLGSRAPEGPQVPQTQLHL